MNTKKVGQISESKFAFECAKRGIVVSQPVGDNAPYDFIIDLNEKFVRVQCKTLRKDGDVYKFQVCSKTGHRRRQSKTTYHGKIEYFFAYNLDDDVYVLVPVEHVGIEAKTLRTSSPKNNQTNGISYVSDYQSWDL